MQFKVQFFPLKLKKRTIIFKVSKKNPRHLYTCHVSEGEEVDVEIQRLIDSQLECHKMGSTIAEEALLQSSNDFSPEMPADMLQDNVFNHEVK